jgi:16S rRNA processing protein RimM
MNNYRNIGKIVAAHGLSGELLLFHHLGKKTLFKGLEAIYLEEKKDEMLPYFLQSASVKSDQEVFLKLEGVESREMARKLVQKEVWLSEPDFLKFAGKSAPISWVGYQVINDGTDLGEILEVIEQPHQLLLRLEFQKKEVLIPINEETLVKTDKKNRKVFVVLPDGLLEIYLSS